MRESRGRELENVVAGVERAFGTALMRQIVQKNDHADDIAGVVDQRRNFGGDRQRPAVEDQRCIGVVEILSRCETGA